MGRRKSSRKRDAEPVARDAEAEAGTVASTSAAAATPEFIPPANEPADGPAIPAGPTRAHGLALGLLGLIGGLGLVGVGAPASHPYPTLIALAGIFLVLSGLVGVAASAPSPLAPRVASVHARLPALAALFAVLSLSALFGRHPPAFAAMDLAHPALLGVASEWLAVLVLLTLPAGGARAGPLHALGLLFLALTLLVPDVVLGVPESPLVGLGVLSRAPALLVMLGAAALALTAALTRAVGKALPRLDRIVGLARRHGAHTLAAAFVLGALFGDGPSMPEALLHAIAAAAAVVTAASHGAPVLARLETAPTDGGPAPGPEARTLEVVALGGTLAVWFLAKTHGLVATNTDDNIYFYMAAQLADGLFPYTDYFFAHPPLHVLLPGVLFSIFGFSMTLAKLIPVLAAAIAALAIFFAVRRKAGPLPAFLGLVLFLFAAETLKASSNMNGVLLTVMWLALGVNAAFAGRPIRSGIFHALAVATGFYAIAPALASIAIGWFRRPDDAPPAAPLRTRLAFGLRQTAAFVAVFGAIQLLFILIAGDAYLDGVYRYHGEKTFQDPGMVELFGGEPGFPGSLFHNLGVMFAGKAFGRELYHEPHLWLGALVLPAAVLLANLSAHGLRGGLLRTLDPRRLFDRTAAAAGLHLWLLGLALVLEFAMFRELYSFYFALIYPFLAAATALAIVAAGRAVASAAPRRSLLVAPTAAALIAVPFGHAHLSDAQLPWFAGEMDSAFRRNTYDFTPAPVLAGFSGLIHDLFWSDARFRGDIDPGVRQYLWNKKRTFSVLGDVAAWVRQHTEPTDTIAGASTLAPLVALEAGRRLAANEADTNNKRFRTGLLSEEAYWSAICEDGVRVLVSAPRSYFTRARLDAHPIVKRHFRLAKTFVDDTIQYNAPLEITVYEATSPCKDGPP